MPARLLPNDPGYAALLEKRFNKRFSARPDYVRLAGSTDEVIAAVEEAVKEGRRLVVTSGGHCLEGFVSDPEVRVILDVSPMKRVYYDRGMGAVAVEAGATVGETFRALYRNWGAVIPLGEYPAIGMGGHVAGGAFGFLCRQLGLAADYLYAVEVVTVDLHGRPGSVVATREASDPNRELWWAHTGGGGGNFGVVTRYWFRSPDSSGEDPADAVAPRAGVDHDLQGGMELERRRPPSAFCDCCRTTEPGASATVGPVRPMRRSGPCSRSIASSSARSSYRGVSTAVRGRPSVARASGGAVSKESMSRGLGTRRPCPGSSSR